MPPLQITWQRVLFYGSILAIGGDVARLWTLPWNGWIGWELVRIFINMMNVKPTLILRLCALPVQGLLVAGVLIYEIVTAGRPERPKRQDESPFRASTETLGVVIAWLFGKRKSSSTGEGASDPSLEDNDERYVYWLIMCMVLMGTALYTWQEIVWTPVFSRIIPGAYLWWNSFSYQEVEHSENGIRLVEVCKGGGDARLICKLVQANAREAEFEALSYAWGSDLVYRRSISVDGRTFWVSDGLFAALRSLRLPDRSRLFWVDQICIDQWSFAEKEDQVQNKMRLVYSLAERVVVWLGPSPQSEIMPLDSPHFWKDLFSRRWWSRVWIIQEVCLSREVVVRFGYHEIPWSELRALAETLEQSNRLRLEEHTRNLLDFSKTWKSIIADQTLSFADLALRFRFNQASDQHDKIYSLLGLFESGPSPPIMVDYAVRTDSLFAEMTVRHVRLSDSLEYLKSTAVGYSPGGPLYASWALNFDHHGIDDKPLPWMAVADIAAYSSCAGRVTSSCKYDPKGRKIGLRGWQADVVKEVASVASEHALSAGIQSWETFWRARSSKPSDSDFVSLLLGCAWIDALPAHWAEWYVDGMVTPRDSPAASLATADLKSTHERYTKRLINVCANRKFFETSNGVFGLGPSGISAGDYVCVLEGSSVPLTLRRAEMNERERQPLGTPMDFEQDYEFVSQAVVEGLMFTTEECIMKDILEGRIRPGEIWLR